MMMTMRVLAIVSGISMRVRLSRRLILRLNRGLSLLGAQPILLHFLMALLESRVFGANRRDLGFQSRGGRRR